MAFGDRGRIRGDRRRKDIRRSRREYIQKYPWMSYIEEQVHLYLEDKGVPFSWRHFDGLNEAPHIAFLMSDYHPEFTLREYKAVIIILGNFFSNIPGIIDRQALAATLLEEDGWKVAVVFEDELRDDIDRALVSKLPFLDRPSIKGRPRPSPWGVPDFMSKRRQVLRAYALVRKSRFFDPNKRPHFRRRRFERRPRVFGRRHRFRNAEQRSTAAPGS